MFFLIVIIFEEKLLSKTAKLLGGKSANELIHSLFKNILIFQTRVAQKAFNTSKLKFVGTVTCCALSIFRTKKSCFSVCLSLVSDIPVIFLLQAHCSSLIGMAINRTKKVFVLTKIQRNRNFLNPWSFENFPITQNKLCLPPLRRTLEF